MESQKEADASSTEAEYIAACDAAKEAIWLQNLLFEIGITKTKNSKLFQDNQEAIFLSKKTSKKTRTNHIDVRYHFIRQNVAEGIITIAYCPKAAMIADILTKPLVMLDFERHHTPQYNWDEYRSGHPTSPRQCWVIYPLPTLTLPFTCYLFYLYPTVRVGVKVFLATFS